MLNMMPRLFHHQADTLQQRKEKMQWRFSFSGWCLILSMFSIANGEREWCIHDGKVLTVNWMQWGGAASQSIFGIWHFLAKKGFMNYVRLQWCGNLPKLLVQKGSFVFSWLTPRIVLCHFASIKIIKYLKLNCAWFGAQVGVGVGAGEYMRCWCTD